MFVAKIRCATCLPILISCVTVVPSAIGQELRIESTVSLNGDEISENLTLFTPGRVYDFRYDTSQHKTLVEIVIFRPSEGDFEIIDVQRRVRFSINKNRIARFVAAMKTNQDLLAKAPHFIEPEFVESWDDESGWLTMTADRITYQVTGVQTAPPVALEAYHDFANWYVKLNAADPRKMPPFARLTLNQALRQRDMIPERVRLTIHPTGGVFNKQIDVSSSHSMVWAINRGDHDLIEQASQLLTQCEPVDRSTYYQLNDDDDGR